MDGLRPPTDPRLIVGVETGDDAGVYRVRDDLALVVTADLITPVLDDPRLFGAIAAANSLSDVYAMGGRPLVALNLCAFPAELDTDAAREILAGAQDAVTEAGAVIAGGHTARSPELLFGLSVTGEVHPDRVLRNRGLRPGDALVLTKPIGSGVLINARRQELISEDDLRAVALRLAVLNRVAADVALRFAPHALTDVTGFGLAGHAYEMACASGCAVRLDLGRVPLYPRAREMAEQGVSTRCTRDNRHHLTPHLRGGDALPRWQQTILFDPQTSGGLLIAVDGDRAAPLCAALRDAGVADAVTVGEGRAAPAPVLEVRPAP
jgi:selenide,water dikinase